MPRDKEKQKKWVKENYTLLTGCRVREEGCFYMANERERQIIVKPEHFLVSNSRLEPFRIYNTQVFIHVPRSLCDRARIVVDKNGKIVSDQPKPPCINK